MACPCINYKDHICDMGITDKQECPYYYNPMFNPMKCKHLMRIYTGGNKPIIPMYPRE